MKGGGGGERRGGIRGGGATVPVTSKFSIINSCVILLQALINTF